MKTKTRRALMATQKLRTAFVILFAMLTGYSTPASAISDAVKQRAQADLKGKCLDFFLSDNFAFLATSVDGYQYWATSLLANAVFSVGKAESEQYCAYAKKTALMTWADAEKLAIANCERSRPQGGLHCEVYAHNNDIVYVSVHERLKTAKSLYEAGDPTANLAIIEVSKKDLSALTSRERGEYEYLAGKSVSKPCGATPRQLNISTTPGLYTTM